MGSICNSAQITCSRIRKAIQTLLNAIVKWRYSMIFEILQPTQTKNPEPLKTIFCHFNAHFCSQYQFRHRFLYRNFTFPWSIKCLEKISLKCYCASRLQWKSNSDWNAQKYFYKMHTWAKWKTFQLKLQEFMWKSVQFVNSTVQMN